MTAQRSAATRRHPAHRRSAGAGDVRRRTGSPHLVAAVAVAAAAAALLLAALAAPAAAHEAAAVEVTTVYVVRHAEKADGSADPDLTDAGRRRAALLARVLGDEALDAVYTTPFTRTRETARPTAEAAGVEVTEYDPADADALAARVLADHPGGRVLVVGHSNTVDDLAAAFGAAGLADLDESEYDHLFVVHHLGGGAHLDQLRYGAPGGGAAAGGGNGAGDDGEPQG